MNKIYDVDYFIKKFEAIPEEKWNDYIQYDRQEDTRCAFGHCDPLNKSYVQGSQTKEGQSLIKIFKSVGWGVTTDNWITDVNNGLSKEYQQSTPKARILAALYDIKAMQQLDHADATASIATLHPIISETPDVIKRKEYDSK